MRRLPLLLLLLLALLPVPAAGAAVDRAVRTVDELRAETRRTAEQLTAGTRRLERAQAVLADVRRATAEARTRAAKAQAQEAEARRLLSAVVASAYRAPAPDEVVLALTTGPEGLSDALAARASLERVQGRQDELLQRAESARQRSAELVEQAEELEAEQEQAAADVAERVEDLRGRARAAERRLGEANARLRRARADAACTSPSGEHPNGFLPRSALCSIGGGHLLRGDAALAFRRMAAERPLCITDSYRSYASQVDVYRRKPALAAVPGTSKHGLGLAVDLGCGAERFGTETYAWLEANAPRFGWRHPSWAEPGGSMPEPWHWEYTG